VTDAEVDRCGWRALIAELATQGRIVSVVVDGGLTLWVAEDRREFFVPQFPATDEALVGIVRGRLEGLGPVTVSAVAAALGLTPSSLQPAFAALEAEGFALRGRFTAEAAAGAEEEWCERRLLARIHRYTVKRLRADIEPIQAKEFLRFLFDWQRVLPAARMQGSDAVAAVLAQLEGFEAPAAAWESDILPARISEYDPQWLDEHCRAGRFAWMRLEARKSESERGAGPIRSTPITLLARRSVKAWVPLTQAHDVQRLSYKPRAVLEFIRERGASFFDDLVDGLGMLPVEVEETLAELVALGLVTSDSFGGLRTLLVPSAQRGRHAGRRGRRLKLFDMADAGRWAVVRQDAAGAGERPAEEAVEHVVRTLLRRWGVIFWKLLAREAAWLPSWRDILMCCRRLEARGEIRGGRFVAGFSGEQYAALDAVEALRAVRRQPLPSDGQYVSLSAADPLNLLGIVTPGARLASLTANRLLYRDGLPVALYAGGEVSFLVDMDAKQQWRAQTALLRRHMPDVLVDDDSPSESPL
jgi:ATP-dependent Lhr-like helicase